MKINVRLFAALKELIGKNRLELTLDGNTATVADVRKSLSSRYPQTEDNLASALASINREYASNQDTVKEGDEVAFFPPVYIVGQTES